jgi:sec-independent protein translocase protein TatB
MVMPHPIQIASLGMADSLILMVMALVVFGPRRLPEIGRQIGKLMYEFRKASNDFKFQMEEELRSAEEAERRKKAEERAAAALAVPAQTPVESNLSEANPAAPQSSTNASPYPGEEVYPPSAASEPADNLTYPRILPPVTGAPVPAHVGNQAVQHEARPVVDDIYQSTSAIEQPPTAPEQVPHG